MHSVKTSKQRCFSASGRSDQGRDFVLIDRQRYILESVDISVVVKIQVFDLDFGRQHHRLYLHFNISRPTIVSMRINKVMTRAAPHAWECQLLYGPIAYWKMVTVSDAMGLFMSVE